MMDNKIHGVTQKMYSFILAPNLDAITHLCKRAIQISVPHLKSKDQRESILNFQKNWKT